MPLVIPSSPGAFFVVNGFYCRPDFFWRVLSVVSRLDGRFCQFSDCLVII
jgi:hypothetical protein